MEGKVAKKMNVLKRYCGSNWGLKHATLIKLYKTLLLPQMLYAAPVWARKHLQTLNKLQHKDLKLILGTKTKFNQHAAENLCGIPPMLIETDVISIKFGIKLSMCNDSLHQRHLNSQLPEIRTDSNLVDQINRFTGTPGAYTKSACLSYVTKRWNNIFRSPLTSTPLDIFYNEVELDGITFPKHVNRRLELTINKLLLNCKMELVEYAYNIWRAESPLYQCRKDTESVAHYLFFCPLFEHYRSPHLAETEIFSLHWIATLINFIMDSGRFFDYKTERIRHY